MKRALLLVLILLNAACAPMATLRTAQPLEAGQRRFLLGLTSPVLLGSSPVPYAPCPPQPAPCKGSPLPFPIVGYTPTPQLLELRWETGLGNNNEFNLSVPLPALGVRLGGKTLLLSEPLRLGVDYGLSGYLVGLGVDAGLLWSLPLEGWEPYGSLRGYWDSWNPQYPSFSVGLGLALPVGEGRWFVELAWAASRASYGGQPVWGWIPAIGYRF